MIKKADGMTKKIAARGAVSLILGAILFLVLWSRDLAPGPWLLGVLFSMLIAGIVVAVAGTLLDHTELVQEADWFGAEQVAHKISRSASDVRLTRLRYLVRDSVDREDRGEALHALLRDLAAERLSRRGLDLEADPAAAYAAMDPPLARYLANPDQGRSRISTRHLSDVVARIEKL